MFPWSITVRIRKVFWRAAATAAAQEGDGSDNGLEKFGCSHCRGVAHA